MKAKYVIIVPETHWDREWYLPFQEYRAKLVLMMDKLLDILNNDPTYTNFTLDGQTIPLEDYLEVRPEKREEIENFVKQKRLSIGPMYILPDEFLVSGESTIRNLLIGHQIAKKFGRVMKAGYIPDPFGHIAQLPQILSGFELPSIIFWRGFGNEFEKNNLNIEFQWNAPGKVASILAIHLIMSYGSVADLNLSKKSGRYKLALHKIKRVINNFEKYIATPIVLLNSGSDHHEAKPEIPEIIREWNEMYPDIRMEQNDFEDYSYKVLRCKPTLKSFQGELRGGKYAHLLSGVLSARMWIKQRNTQIEYLYEKYTEPISTITWVLDKYEKFNYPNSYILTGLRWLLKNHPHDSICGCSIDQVHREMTTRFDWAEQIGEEIFKNSIIHLSNLVKLKDENNIIPLIIYNPLPWKRNDIVQFNIISNIKSVGLKTSDFFRIINTEEEEVEYQIIPIKENPRYTQVEGKSALCTFIADVPACGYSTYYIIPEKKPSVFENTPETLHLDIRMVENQFYKVKVSLKGDISVFDKESKVWYEKICFFEDIGDWGDEYDFSGPNDNQTDLRFTSEDLNILSIQPYFDGPTHKTLLIKANLNLPASFSEDRYNRDTYLVSNPIDIYISLYNDIKRIDFRIDLENNSKDHRIRVLFPSMIISNQVEADGHFYVISRDIELPNSEGWAQKALPTNHQKDFVSINDNMRTFAVFNKGLPEYEAIKNEDNTIIIAITLLRCIEWLSRVDVNTRRSNAGPDLNTPEAQCLGKHTFELSLVIESNKPNWIESNIHGRAKEFNNPLKIIFPFMARTSLRVSDRVVLLPFGILSYFGATKALDLEPYLPEKLSFIEINNNKIILSALKRSEEGNNLILRVYNISPTYEEANVSLYDGLIIEKVELVNLLEEKPINLIKAKIVSANRCSFKISLDSHVIATFRITIKKK